MNANIDSQSSFSKLRITDPKAAIVCTEYLLNLKPHESQHQFSISVTMTSGMLNKIILNMDSHFQIRS